MRIKKYVALSIALLIACQASDLMAQLPNQSRTSPLNYIARFHGLGYSDGYHACPDDRCGNQRSWLSGLNFSSYYGSPSAPTPRSSYQTAPSYRHYQAAPYAIRPGATPPAYTQPMVQPIPMHSPSPSTSPLTPIPEATPQWEEIPQGLPSSGLRNMPGANTLMQSQQSYGNLR